VASATRNDKHVPDRMKTKTLVIADQERGSKCVAKSADQYPPKCGCRYKFKQRLGGNYRHPTQEHVCPNRNAVDAMRKKNLAEETTQSQRPHHPEQQPPSARTQVDQRKGSVRSDDKQIDRSLIESLEQTYQLRLERAVRQCGESVNGDQGHRKDTATRNPPSVSRGKCADD
jgi:hypothetical protein